MRVGKALKYLAVVLAASVALLETSVAQPYRVGGRTDAAPYGFFDENSQALQGYYVDLIAEIGRQAGFEYEFQPVPFRELARSLVAGEIDIICANFGILDTRRAMGIAYSTPTSLSTDGMIVPATDFAEHLSFNDFAGKVVGVIAGTTHETALKNAGIFKEVKTYPTSAELIAAVENGEIEAARQAAAGIAYDIKVRGLYPKARFVDSYVPTQILEHGIAVRRADSELLDRINVAIARLAADGTMSTLASQWQIPLPIAPFLTSPKP